MRKKTKLYKAIIACCVIIGVLAAGVLGYTIYTLHQADSLVFSSYGEEMEKGEESEGIWSIPINKENISGTYTSSVEISNHTTDMTIRSLKLEDSEAWEPYLASLTVTINGTNIIARDIIDGEALNFELSQDASCYILIEYSFKQNITDTSGMPDHIQISPVI